MHVGEPAMVNLCSQEAVHDVLEHVRSVCNVSENKQHKWISIISDDFPYILASNIQYFLLSCRECKLIVDKKGVTMEEFEEFLHDQEVKC